MDNEISRTLFDDLLETMCYHLEGLDEGDRLDAIARAGRALGAAHIAALKADDLRGFDASLATSAL
jgi:hypothetical protein